MKFWKVERTDKSWDRCYDETVSCFVRAESMSDAINLAKTLGGDQEPGVWDLAKVTEISEEGPREVLEVFFRHA